MFCYRIDSGRACAISRPPVGEDDYWATERPSVLSSVSEPIPASAPAAVPHRQWLLLGRSCASFLLAAGTLAGVYALSQYNYLLFHTLVETFSAIVAFAVFMLFWNAQGFLKNGFFLFMGIACLIAGIFDLAHAWTAWHVDISRGHRKIFPCN